jgi:hypothetical protein
MGEGLK